jgi:hypothetical protein
VLVARQLDLRAATVLEARRTVGPPAVFLGERARRRVARDEPEDCPIEAVLVEVPDDMPQEVGPDAAAPARGIDVDLVDLAQPGLGVVVA